MEKRAYTESFARIYDDIMGAVPYDLWYSYLHELLDYYQVKPNKVLDLACGTGNMSLRFARDGYKVTGVDRSEQMLKVARDKAVIGGEMIIYYNADLRDFHLPENYDFAFSLFDSLNYILEAEDLFNVFKNVYNSLYNDGLFIFDMNTLERLMSIKPGTTILNGDGYTCLWEDIIDRESSRWKVKLKIHYNGELDGEENYYEEIHEETGYEVCQVEQLLREAGFEYIDIFNAYTFEKGEDKNNRLYFIAFKDIDRVKKKRWTSRLVKSIKWRLMPFIQ